MFQIKRGFALLIIAALMLAAGCGGANTGVQSIQRVSDRRSDPGPQSVVDWNVIALQTSAAAAFNPPLESRNLAIVQGAVYDAVVAITGGYRQFLFVLPAARDASPVAAVAAAAHDTLVSLYPAQQTSLDATYMSYLSKIGSVAGLQAGIAVGQQAAAHMLAARATDGSDTIVAYTPGTAPGDWQPAPPLFKPALEPGWGNVTPFLLRSGDQFRPVAPPALTSATYTADFNEIKSIGSATSATRTADQTTTAHFWVSTGPQLWNQIPQQLVIADRFTIAQAARAFAALNLAGADAFIAAWDAKFTYNQWRPIMAIRNAADDGNPDTVADVAWTPLLPTPPFPDYPAAHAVNAGASEIVLTAIFGTSPGAFQIVSANAPSVVHRYNTFQAVAEETVNARVWGGIHWRTSCTVGRAIGQQVGAFDLQHGLQPAR